MDIFAALLEQAAHKLDDGPYPVTEVGPYRITMVDEEMVRNTSEEFEEYTNYAIRSDFPDSEISDGEIWLSDHVPADERWILIEEAITRMDAERNGAHPDDAYESGVKHSKALRKRRHQEGPDHIDTPVRLKRLGYVDEPDSIAVWLVDGEAIRDTVDADFVEGGHGYVYPWCPKDEIWVDIEVPADERHLIIAHEYHEMTLMREGTPYEVAHKEASHYEWRIRETTKHT